MISAIKINIKNLLKVAGILTALFIVLIISLWVWIATLDLNTQTLRIEQLASQALGRDVKIDGPLHFRLSLFPRITIENAYIANPQWAIFPDFLTIEKLEVEISLLSLLEKKLVFEDIELTGATINLQQDPKKGSSWDFSKPNKQQSSSQLITDLVELDAHQITIRYYPVDRPPLTMFIDDFHAELSPNQAVNIQLKAKINDLPLNIDVQGGTFEQLINPTLNWPYKGVVDTDTREIDFYGHITNLITFDDIELQISSEKKVARESVIFGRQFEPLIEYYSAKLNINTIDDTYTIKLAADAHNFDLSRLYTIDKRSQKPSLTYQDFNIKAEGSGHSMTEILQATVVNITGSHIDYRHPSNRPDKKFFQAHINSLQVNSTQNSDFELLLNGTASDIPFKVRANTKDILFTLWQKKSTPVELSIESKGATAQINGHINHHMNLPQFTGEVSMQAESLTIIGNLLGHSWLETLQLKAQSQLIINNRTLTFNNTVAQLGSQKAQGKIKLSYNNGFTLSIKAHADNIVADKIFPKNKIPPQLTFNLEQINLNMLGKSEILPQRLFASDWNLTATKGKASWCDNTMTTNCTLALSNLDLSTQGNNPLKINAQGLFNQLPLALDAEFGRLGLLINNTQASTSLYHPLNLKISTDELVASFQGALHKPFKKLMLQGELQVEGKLSSFTQAINKPLKFNQKISMSAQVATQRDALTLTNINANTDGIILKGELSYQHTQSPKLTASTSGSINLAHYIDKSNKTKRSIEQSNKQSPDEKEKNTNRIVPKISLDYSQYRWLDALVNIQDFSINYNDTSVLKIDSQFIASNGLFKLSPINALSTSNGRTSVSSIELDSSRPLNTIKYSIQADKIDYGNILKQLEVTNEIRGEMDLNIDISGQGYTLREAVESSHGELKIVADKGKVPRWLLELWGSGLLRSLFPTTWLEDSSTELNCAVGHFKVENGIMRSQTLLTDTKRVTVAGEVIIDWRTEHIEGILKPHPKEVTLVHIGSPLRISGSLKNYKISSAESSVVTLGKWAIGLSNPATIILLFGNTGTKDKNPCESLMQEHANSS